jgi:GT2 family glycosyltransferase
LKERVYIVILNWNGTADTIDCLISLKENNYNNFIVILTDNGSEKENLNNLKVWCNSNYSRVNYYSREQAENGGIGENDELLEEIESKNRLVFIENGENLGFASGNNVALRYLLKKNAVYVMLLNNDTVIEKESLTLLMNFINKNDNYVAVSPQIRYYIPNNRIWNCGGKITWYGNRKYFYEGAHMSNVPQSGNIRVTFLTGCALLFKPNITGILTEKFFFGEEDLDFCFRQKLANRKMACYLPSIIYHKVNASIKKVDANIVGSVYLHYLARLINNKQYSGRLLFFVIVVLHFAYAIPMVLFRYKIGIKQSFRMIMAILTELRIKDSIDKAYHLKFLREDFKVPVKFSK